MSVKQQGADVTANQRSEGVRPRIPALDIARTGALVAMIVFHFVFDLELFGHLPRGTSTSGGWRILAVATAGSFLGLAGVSLWMAHGRGIRWRAFWRRFAILALAALAVTVATYVAFPHAFVFFGILHAIALCSLLGLLVIRLPALILAALAVAVFFAPDYASSPTFDAPWWWWTGLQTVPISTVDYEPIFPWFAPFLMGLAAAKAAERFGLWSKLEVTGAPGPLARRLSLPGQHSLLIYLLHQPVLLGLVGGITWALGS